MERFIKNIYMHSQNHGSKIMDLRSRIRDHELKIKDREGGGGAFVTENTVKSIGNHGG